MWKPLPINFEIFRNQKPETGIVDEIIVVNEALFGTDEEFVLNMSFYDGYAIEQRTDNMMPIVMPYPTVSQIMKDPALKQAIIEYAQGASEDDIVPYDSALRFGILYNESRCVLG